MQPIVGNGNIIGAAMLMAGALGGGVPQSKPMATQQIHVKVTPQNCEVSVDRRGCRVQVAQLKGVTYKLLSVVEGKLRTPVRVADMRVENNSGSIVFLDPREIGNGIQVEVVVFAPQLPPAQNSNSQSDSQSFQVSELQKRP